LRFGVTGASAGRGQPADRLPTKPFSRTDEAGLKPRCAMIILDQITRLDHVGIHHQPGLRPVLREIPGRSFSAGELVDLTRSATLLLAGTFASLFPLRPEYCPYAFIPKES
jgi:hypothetical protein